MVSVNGYTAEHMLDIENDTIVGGSVQGNELVLVTKDGSEVNVGPIVESPSGNASEVVMFGKPGEMGTAQALSKTSTGERVETVEIKNFNFEPGMGPFFSQVLPDGTIAMPQIQLPINQTVNTGKNMSMAFWSQQENAFYSVVVPTSTGAVEVLSVNSSSGVVGAAGGADLSDCAIATVNGQTVLFALSAFPYRGWDISVYGEYPTLAAFVKSDTTGRWVYSQSLSIFPSTLQASDATYGSRVWPDSTNYYGQNVVVTKLPSEISILPQSGHLVIAVYGPRTGQNSGAMIVVNPTTKAQVGYYEFPDFSSPSGATFRAFPRDINADPTSSANDERILMNFDMFYQPNETFNVIVAAASGTFTITWGGATTTALNVGATQREVREALEAIVAIGANNVKVKLTRPFVVSTYSVYEVQLVGTLRATNLSATTASIDTTSLVTNNNSRINRWQTGGTAYSKPAPFPMVEMAYNSSTGAITQKTTLMIPHDASSYLGYPETLDARFASSWFDAKGTAWMTVKGANSNPEATTAFAFQGLHGWRKTAGERRYVTDNPPLSGWESRFGEAQPYPDITTYGLHKDTNASVLGIAEDVASGGIITVASNGKLKFTDPTSGLANRTANLFSTTSPTAWTIVSGSSHSGVWDGAELAFAMTAGSVDSMQSRSLGGTSGIASPASYEGQLIQGEIDVKAATVSRQNTVVFRFYDSGGTEINVLSGFGHANINSLTTGYVTVVGSAIIPVGTRYISMGVQVSNPAISEIHYVKRAIMYLAACTPVADMNLNTSSLYVGAVGSTWASKGYVDPDTRRLWLPFAQQTSTVEALNTRYPGWLVSVKMANKFRDRRAIATREPIPHKSTHATGGSDALSVTDIGAAPLNNPAFTGSVTIPTGAVAGTPDVKGEALTTTGFRWDATLGWIIVAGGVDRWRVGTSGNLLPITTNASDIGATTNRIKDLYTQGSIFLTALTLSQGGGSPEGSVTAPVGSVRLDTNGIMWLKISGSGNTGWAAFGNFIANRQTASYTLALTDRTKLVEMNVAGANNLTVPPNGTVTFLVGTIIECSQYGAGLTTIVPGSGVTVNSRGGRLNSAGQFARFKLEKIASNEWYASGDLA